ncbi:TPA: hypothetical protein DIV48_03145 [Candidatus Kaiserbacteria bacterium]|nr:hypothetical protein [Candidatus Kaiserbacteria bacterium]
MVPLPAKIIAPFVLLSFLTLAFFGFTGMSYGSNGQMQGDCPFSAVGTSLCPPSALPGALHHLSAYQSFLNVPVGSAFAALIIGLLLIAFGLLAYRIQPRILPVSARGAYCTHDPPVSARTWKLTRWLSLLENSPAPL